MQIETFGVAVLKTVTGFLNKPGLNVPNESSTPHWVKLAQSQIDAANKAIYELTGTPVPQSKVNTCFTKIHLLIFICRMKI